MQGIYTYIPETNYVPREYSAAAILLLLFMVLMLLVSVLNIFIIIIKVVASKLRHSSMKTENKTSTEHAFCIFSPLFIIVAVINSHLPVFFSLIHVMEQHHHQQQQQQQQ